jgi:hypothetical protein
LEALQLNCYKEKGITLYGNCDFPKGIKGFSDKDPAIKVFPNPVTDYLTIETEMIDVTINVETIFGEIILRKKCQPEKQN